MAAKRLPATTILNLSRNGRCSETHCTSGQPIGGGGIVQGERKGLICRTEGRLKKGNNRLKIGDLKGTHLPLIVLRRGRIENAAQRVGIVTTGLGRGNGNPVGGAFGVVTTGAGDVRSVGCCAGTEKRLQARPTECKEADGEQQ